MHGRDIVEPLLVLLIDRFRIHDAKRWFEYKLQSFDRRGIHRVPRAKKPQRALECVRFVTAFARLERVRMRGIDR